jgi:cell division protein ZapA
MAEKQGVKVEIYEQAYHVRVNSEADAEQIVRTAAYVDSKIRAVAAQTRDVDSLRLAVLAALHIADEYHTLQARYDALRSTVEHKSTEMSRLLDLELRNAS